MDLSLAHAVSVGVRLQSPASAVLSEMVHRSCLEYHNRIHSGKSPAADPG